MFVLISADVAEDPGKPEVRMPNEQTERLVCDFGVVRMRLDVADKCKPGPALLLGEEYHSVAPN